MVNLDAAAIHASVTIPSLLIGGRKDLQCLPQDVEKIASIVKGPVQSHVFDELTHILRSDPDTATVSNYLQLSLQDVDKRVLESISSWLISQTENTIA
jgi:pimeloyl-ACP methyl ester carboxylesterase